MNQPQIIIGIVMHDTGRRFGCFGEPGVHSPNIDRMAAEGVRFENHFSTGSVCVPSRASILTGRYFHSAELCRYREGCPSLPRSLKSAGYRCIRLGFAEEKEYASPAGAPLPYPDADSSGTALLGYDSSWTQSALAADVADRLIALLRDRKSEKLYICASFREAHSPYNAEISDGELGSTPLPPGLPGLPDHPETRRLIAQMNRLISDGDRAVGQITDFIRQNGLYDQTLLWFSADHGADLPAAKQTCYDKGTEVPLILWGGALPKSGLTLSGLSSHLDIAPTLCELAGASPPEGGLGISQVPQLLNGSAPRSFCVSEVSRDNPGLPIRSIRTERYRYIRNFNPGWPVPMAHTLLRRLDRDLLAKAYGTPRPEEELYDLSSDPAQQNNLASDPAYSAVKAELMSQLYAELARSSDPIFYPDSEYSIRDEEPLAFWRRDENGEFYLSEEK